MSGGPSILPRFCRFLQPRRRFKGANDDGHIWRLDGDVLMRQSRRVPPMLLSASPRRFPKAYEPLFLNRILSAGESIYFQRRFDRPPLRWRLQEQ